MKEHTLRLEGIHLGDTPDLSPAQLKALIRVADVARARVEVKGGHLLVDGEPVGPCNAACECDPVPAVEVSLEDEDGNVVWRTPA